MGRVKTVLSETICKNAHDALRMCIVLREMAATVPPLFSFISKCNLIACTVAAIHSQTPMQKVMQQYVAWGCTAATNTPAAQMLH